jgi:hypothetical protein
MRAGHQTRDRVAVILFCLISTLTALDPSWGNGHHQTSPPAQQQTAVPSQSEHNPRLTMKFRQPIDLRRLIGDTIGPDTITMLVADSKVPLIAGNDPSCCGYPPTRFDATSVMASEPTLPLDPAMFPDAWKFLTPVPTFDHPAGPPQPSEVANNFPLLIPGYSGIWLPTPIDCTNPKNKDKAPCASDSKSNPPTDTTNPPSNPTYVTPEPSSVFLIITGIGVVFAGRALGFRRN